MRFLTEREKESFWSLPNLDLDNAVCTQERSDDYNCISFAKGVRDRWIDPESDVPENHFKDFFIVHNESEADIALYFNNGELRHAAKKNRRHGMWESKCGGNVGILHTIPELFSNTYGTEVVFMKK